MPVTWTSKSLGQDEMKRKIYGFIIYVVFSLYGINASSLLGTDMGGKLSFLW